jgi:peptide/nickel transport system permease protein
VTSHGGMTALQPNVAPQMSAARVLRPTAVHPLIGMIARRLLLGIPTLLVVSALGFALASLAPGDAAESILGLNATPESLAALRHQLGLDLPLHQQYWHWLRAASHGDLGTSTSTGQPVRQVVEQRLPVTLCLMVGALLVSVVVGVLLGLFSARRGGFVGRVIDALATLGFAVPAFWIGAELISLFAVQFPLFPATGYVNFETSPREWLSSLVLPIVALSLASIAAILRTTREAVLETLGLEYIRMARASGLGQRSIYFRHVLKNASLRIVTIVGVQAVGMLAGTIFVESVFALPGLGSAVSSGALAHDLPLVEGISVVFTLMVIFINIATDVTYVWANPRVRVG